MSRADIPAVSGTVTTQAITMFLWRENDFQSSTVTLKISFNRLMCNKLFDLLFLLIISHTVSYLKSPQSTPCRLDLAQPTKTTEPTLQCVVEMGRPALEASKTVKAEPISMVNPEEAVTLVRSSPMVWITRRPHTHRPTEMPI